MNELSIKCILSEDTRLGAVTIHNQIYDLHEGIGDDSINYYITKHGDGSLIYAIITKELYELMFN